MDAVASSHLLSPWRATLAVSETGHELRGKHIALCSSMQAIVAGSLTWKDSSPMAFEIRRVGAMDRPALSA